MSRAYFFLSSAPQFDECIGDICTGAFGGAVGEQGSFSLSRCPRVLDFLRIGVTPCVQTLKRPFDAR